MGICLSFQNSCDTNSSGYIIYYIVDTQLKMMKYINYFRHQNEPDIHHCISFLHVTLTRTIRGILQGSQAFDQ